MKLKLAPAPIYKQLIKYFPRLTVDVLITDDKLGYLLFKRNTEPSKGKFWPIGGTVYRGETLRGAAIRKAIEEAGVNPKLLKPAGIVNIEFSERHDIGFVFLATLKDRSKIKLSRQNSEYKWFKKLPPHYRLIKFDNL